MMASQAAYQSGNYAAAIGHWKNVLSVLPVNSPDVELIKTEIADAQLKMRGSGKP
jgi:cytochrome c-type biogenesis protein CcmH/NrfG